jgi:hypothetical protein
MQVRLQTKAEDIRFLSGCQDDLSFLDQTHGPSAPRFSVCFTSLLAEQTGDKHYVESFMKMLYELRVYLDTCQRRQKNFQSNASK